MPQLLEDIGPRNVMGGKADGQRDRHWVFIERDFTAHEKASLNTQIGKKIRRYAESYGKSKALYIYAYINSLRPSDAYMRQ